MIGDERNGARPASRAAAARTAASRAQPTRARAGGATRAIVLGLVVVGALGAAIYALYCPCERVPGVYLLGGEVATPVEDWSFANSVPLCQIQVGGALLPHAVNLNCMSAEGALYLSCSRCQGKTWSTRALEEPYARLRVGQKVYPVHLFRLRDASRLDRAWQARSTKLGLSPDQARPDHWWSFAVTSR